MSSRLSLLQHFLAADLQANGERVAIEDQKERFPLSHRLRKTQFPVHGIEAHIQNAEYYALSNIKDHRFRIIARDSDGHYRIAAFRFHPNDENRRWELRGCSRGVKNLAQFPKLQLDLWSASPLKRAV